MVPPKTQNKFLIEVSCNDQKLITVVLKALDIDDFYRHFRYYEVFIETLVQ